MRRQLACMAVMVLSLLASPRTTTAYSQNCDMVACGAACLHGGPYDGWCNPPAPDGTGCVMLDSGCASMDTSCCNPVAP